MFFMAWTNEVQPFGPNHAPLLTGWASDGSNVSVPVAVDPATGRIYTDTVVSFTPTALTTVLSGIKLVTTAGTRVNLASNAIASITIKALSTNTGVIYVGGSAVAAANGYQLFANDTVSFDMDNTNAVWLDSSVNAEGISWLAVD